MIFLYILFISFVTKQKWVYKKKDVCFIILFRFTLFRNEHISNCLVCYILFQSFSYISYSFHLLRNRNGFMKKKDVCFIDSFLFTLFSNEHISNCLVCYILFQRFSSISYSFHLLRNRNGFIKDVCFNVSFRFTLLRNEHISNFLVCYILFQRFSSMSYMFHLLRNRNGFIKKVYVSLFHFVTFCYVTSIFQIFGSVYSCFRVLPLYFIRFICYETEMGL